MLASEPYRPPDVQQILLGRCTIEGKSVHQVKTERSLKLVISTMEGLLGGSWDLVSIVTSTLAGAIITHEYSYLNSIPSKKSHEALRRV